MKLPDDEILDLHRQLTARGSVSGDEGPLADFVHAWLEAFPVTVERLEQSVVATLGSGPLLLLDTHLDTVPPADGWSRDPLQVESVDGRVYGLGANDAKASMAAMMAAFVELEDAPPPITVALALVEGEETSGLGTERVLAWLAARGATPIAAVVGEPTGLDIATAQKGLLIVELESAGDACHAAHAAALGARNAIRLLAEDLHALAGVDLGAAHPLLGPTTLEPTLVEGGRARNVIPGAARATLDLRTTPAVGHDALIARLEASVRHARVRVVSQRLEPRATDPHATIVQAARRARPTARLLGSATMSDLVFMQGWPAIKCGPGRSERSHVPDEYVLESEILEGARFYAALLRHFIELHEKETSNAASVG